MTIRDKPTFDPYSIGEFSVKDVLRNALLSWKKHKLAFLGLAIVAALPTVITIALEMSFWSYLASGFTITFLVAVISPMVARLARGLSGDLRGSMGMVRDSIGQTLIVGTGLTLVITGPCLVLLPYGLLAAYGGLILGVIVASPFVISIPVAVIEEIPLGGLVKRSLFLVRGRVLRVVPLLALAVLAAVLPQAVRLAHPTVAIGALILQPFLIAFAAVGIGALYANLYQR